MIDGPLWHLSADLEAEAGTLYRSHLLNNIPTWVYVREPCTETGNREAAASASNINNNALQIALFEVVLQSTNLAANFS